jgi:hypothetical protein
MTCNWTFKDVRGGGGNGYAGLCTDNRWQRGSGAAQDGWTLWDCRCY